MIHIFISYAKKDTRELALALDDALNAIDGVTAWADRSLRAGRSWELQIQSQIDRCDCVIVLYSPDLNRHQQGKSESYVLTEIAYAKYTAKKPIIPVMAQMTAPPISLTLEHYIDFTLDGLTLDDLVDAICAEIEISQSVLIAPPKPSHSRKFDILPAPFDWIEIPARANILGYSISKYPITNAQFAKFVDAGGYIEKKWWTEAGWRAREEDWHYGGRVRRPPKPWIEPRYWRDAKWNGNEQPVIGISWYEAIAFCLWLSEVTDEQIMLSTEYQWQYAAQGDDGRTYPWGDKWDCTRCNNSVEPCLSNKTTLVTHYEGKDTSPFGVVDMAGNVSEWCLTGPEGRQTLDGMYARVLRGGFWGSHNLSTFRCDNRSSNVPFNVDSINGFRVVHTPYNKGYDKGHFSLQLSSFPTVYTSTQSIDILPAPFEWVEIPARANSVGYSIAKYPITNAQFAKFIESSGYQEEKWWTKKGWQQLKAENWTQSYLWEVSEWNGAEQPIVGVSAFEAEAFCQWLSTVTGEKIVLPTENQWQYAAQGDDGREYPWGDEWDCTKCNNSVSPCSSHQTKHVTHYEGIGNSPFGVVDMVGNVWEWCLAEGDELTNEATIYVQRGGSWYDTFNWQFSCDARTNSNLLKRSLNIGFRIVRYDE